MKLGTRRISSQLLLRQALGLVALLAACHAAPKRASISAQTSPIAASARQQLEQQLTDSLHKYWHLTEFVQRDDKSQYVVYGTHTAQGDVGVVALTDSVLLLYQASPHGVQLTARLPFPDYASTFKQVEVNGDGELDFIVYGRPNMHGQAEPFVFLNRHGRLQYRPDLKQYDLAYNFDNGLVSAYYAASGTSVSSKELYRWEGDSLHQVAGADFDLGRLRVTVFRLQRGKRVGVRTYPNPAVYDTVLFRTLEL